VSLVPTRSALLLSLLLATLGATGACGQTPAELCGADADCDSCERCVDGACLIDAKQLNACGQCSSSPEDPCCGDGRRDLDELCDGDCPSSCEPPDACTLATLSGSPETCDASCEQTPITACTNGDGCCAPGCDHSDDDDCPQPCEGSYPCSTGCCAWSIETVDGAEYTGEHAALVVDGLGHPHLSYFDGITTDLKYGYYDGASWSLEAIDASNDSGRYTAIALDSQDRPLIAYQDDGYGEIKLARREGVGWAVETVASPGMNARYAGLAVDDGDIPHLCFQADYGLPIDLEYAVWDGAVWQTETVDTGGTVGKYASIALDAQGRPHLSYSVMYGGESSWRYAYRDDGGAWQITTIDSSFTFDVVEDTSIAVDGAGVVHISASSGIVSYARGSGAVFDVVDVAGGSYTSLALDPSGQPLLAYHDGLAGTLNFAYRIGAAWASQVVDDAGTVGTYAALAVGPDGAPHIAYHDRSNRQLKLAR